MPTTTRRTQRPGAITTRVPLATLKRTAQSCAEHQGHQLGPWHDTHTHGSTATCTTCHAGVTANPEPARNDLELMGLAMTTTCPGRTNP